MPIHFYFCWQVDWQEYSEFSNSALLISSAPGSGTNRELRIFRNSEYRQYSVNGILSVSCTDPDIPALKELEECFDVPDQQSREPEFIFHKNQKFAIRRLKREMERRESLNMRAVLGAFCLRGGFIMIKLNIIFMTLDLGQGRGG